MIDWSKRARRAHTHTTRTHAHQHAHRHARATCWPTLASPGLPADQPCCVCFASWVARKLHAKQHEHRRVAAALPGSHCGAARGRQRQRSNDVDVDVDSDSDSDDIHRNSDNANESDPVSARQRARREQAFPTHLRRHGGHRLLATVCAEAVARIAGQAARCSSIVDCAFAFGSRDTITSFVRSFVRSPRLSPRHTGAASRRLERAGLDSLDEAAQRRREIAGARRRRSMRPA